MAVTMSKATIDNTERATANIIQFARTEWAVPSRTELGVVYRVDHTPDGYRCNCPAGQRGRGCWHIKAVDEMVNPTPQNLEPEWVRERFEADRRALGVALLRGQIDGSGRPIKNR